MDELDDFELKNSDIENNSVNEADDPEEIDITPVGDVRNVDGVQGNVRHIEDEGESLFENVDDLDDPDDSEDADDAAGDGEFGGEGGEENVDISVKGPVHSAKDAKKPLPASAAKVSRSRKKSGSSGSNRHAVTTSRGVVYVESYSDDEYEETPGRKSTVTRIVIAAVVVAAVTAIVFMFINYCRGVVKGDWVYNGITLNGKSVAGMSRTELVDYINKTYADPVSNAAVTVKSGEDSLAYPMNSIFTLPDTESLADEIYGYARSGGLVSRAFTVLKLRETGKAYSLDYKVNQNTIQTICAAMAGKSQPRVDPTYTIEEEQVVFTYGKNGVELRNEDVAARLTAYTDEVLKALADGNSIGGGGTVVLTPVTTEFTRILKVNVVNELPEKPSDARIEKRSGKELWIEPEIEGAEYDEALLDEIVNRINAGEGDPSRTEILPLAKKKPILTKEFYQGVLFRNTLGSSSNKNVQEDDTTKAGSKAAREKNLTLAAGLLDGLVFLPGETIDFSAAVKLSDAKTGYAEAFENYFGADKPFTGGGLSQLATALYNAAYLADLEIVAHTKYKYAPAFGLIGFDAYVNEAENARLVIKNTSGMPIRLSASYTGDTVRVAINGTVYFESDVEGVEPADIPVETVKSFPEKSLSSQIARRSSYSTLYFDDPEMPEGVNKTIQTGVNGYTINLYVITGSGSNADRQFIGVETYESRQEMVRKGTAKATEDPTPPTEIPTEVPTEIPTDDPGDPTGEPGHTDEPAPSPDPVPETADAT